MHLSSHIDPRVSDKVQVSLDRAVTFIRYMTPPAKGPKPKPETSEQSRKIITKGRDDTIAPPSRL